MKLQKRLLVLFLVSLSVFRIDLSFQLFSFNLTPAVLSSSLLLFCFVIFSYKKNPVWPSTFFKIYALLCLLILLFFGINLVLQFELSLQIKRFVLFSLVIVSSIIFILLFHQASDKRSIINSFIKYSFYLYVIFSSFQIFHFLRGEFYLTHTDTIPGVSLLPQTIGALFPRLTGGFIDPNVGGYFLIFQYLISQEYNVQPSKRKFFALFIFLTLSRSAVGAFIIIWLLNKAILLFYQKKLFALSLRKLQRLMMVFFTSLALLTLVVSYTNIEEKLLSGIEARLSNKDSSTSIHVELVEIAFNKPLERISTSLFGFGLFSSSIYTEDIFNSKYGNFHSEYLTIFFENGALGFLLYSLLFIIPIFVALHQFKLLRHRFVILLVVAIALENVFYQQYLFYYYWVILALIWYHLSFSIKQENSHDIHQR